MDYSEIKINNRLQIESENENPNLRCVRGIVLDINSSEIVFITDFGALITIDPNAILSITKITFDKLVSDALVNLKNYFSERYEMERKLKSLKEKEEVLIEELFDANFLSKFNIVGAKNRLDKSIDKKLLTFKRGSYDYVICFGCNPNNQIELMLKVINLLEYYSSDNINPDRLIRAHAPDEGEVIKRSFSFNKTIEEVGKNVVYDKENWYSVYTTYRMFVDIDETNFLDKREEIIKGLEKLRQ